ncbi:MAG: adenylosuccinate lyase, partial [Candidatus Chloroheliales bacterium]
MIARYSFPQMTALWADQNKVDTWLKVEIAVAEAWAEAGIVPTEALPAIRGGSVNLARMQEIERETDHDVIAFLRAVGETVGEASRYIHLGLTSSDVVDTGLSLQATQAADLLLEDVDELMTVLSEQALRYKDVIT